MSKKERQNSIISSFQDVPKNFLEEIVLHLLNIQSALQQAEVALSLVSAPCYKSKISPSQPSLKT